MHYPREPDHRPGMGSGQTPPGARGARGSPSAGARVRPHRAPSRSEPTSHVASRDCTDTRDAPADSSDRAGDLRATDAALGSQDGGQRQGWRTCRRRLGGPAREEAFLRPWPQASVKVRGMTPCPAQRRRQGRELRHGHRGTQERPEQRGPRQGPQSRLEGRLRPGTSEHGTASGRPRHGLPVTGGCDAAAAEPDFQAPRAHGVTGCGGSRPPQGREAAGGAGARRGGRRSRRRIRWRFCGQVPSLPGKPERFHGDGLRRAAAQAQRCMGPCSDGQHTVRWAASGHRAPQRGEGRSPRCPGSVGPGAHVADVFAEAER